MRRATSAPRGAHPSLSAAFTLIELMAVLMLIGLLAAIALPNIGIRSGRVLDGESRQLAADLEFARQRAVMTGIPHRVSFDLETMAYWTEWYVSEIRALGVEELEALLPETGDPQEEAPIQMSPPRTEEPAWRRLTGVAGNLSRIDSLIFIDGIETSEGYIDRGELHLVFERDGTADPAWIVLADDDGRAVTLAVAPLADSVRFEYGSL